MATCPNGHASPDGQRFCGQCGAQIAPTEPAAPEPAASTQAAGGAEYPSQKSQEPPHHSRVSKRPFWITVGVIFGLIVVISAIAGAVGGRDNKANDQATHDCPSGMYYDDVSQSCTPRAPLSTNNALPAATVPPTVFTPPSPPPPPPPPPSVTYDLTGQGTVFVTMQNASGGTEQFETRLPYHLDLGPAGTFGGLSGFVYISAQLQSSGTVTCQIKKGEQVIQTATSTGQYVIASCSGSV
jgi:hypothetical protein